MPWGSAFVAILFTDQPVEELHAFAAKLGCSRASFEVSSKGIPFYKLTRRTYDPTVDLGCELVSAEVRAAFFNREFVLGEKRRSVSVRCAPTGNPLLAMDFHADLSPLVGKAAAVCVNGVWFERSPFQEDWQKKWDEMGREVIHAEG